MSEPAHHNRVELCGAVEGLYRQPNGRTAGVMLKVVVEEEALIVVMVKDLPRVAKGQRLFVRGTLVTVAEPGQRYPLVAVLARTVDVLKPPPKGS